MQQEVLTSATATNTRSPWVRLVFLSVVLFAVWLVWSGLFKPLLIGLGIFSCGLTVFVLHRMRYFSDETYALHYGPRLLALWAWLAKEIVISSLQVAREVLSPNIELSPRVIDLDVSSLDPVDQVLLGNSITLTPGTLTLDVHKDRIKVHCLTEAGAASLEAGEMQRRVAALRGR